MTGKYFISTQPFFNVFSNVFFNPIYLISIHLFIHSLLFYSSIHLSFYHTYSPTCTCTCNHSSIYPSIELSIYIHSSILHLIIQVHLFNSFVIHPFFVIHLSIHPSIHSSSIYNPFICSSLFCRSLQAFQKILILSPSFARLSEVHVRIGIIMKTRGDIKNALKVCNRGLTHVLNFIALPLTLSFCLGVQNC